VPTVLLLVAATDRELCGHDGLVCGIGPVEAAVATARALALHPVEALLHVGIAGARGLDPGTVVVGTTSVYSDLSAEWAVVERVEADPTLVASALEALPGAVGARIDTSAAVGGAVGVPGQEPLVEAMEGFGVLRAATLANVPALEVRAISNAIGEADRSRWPVAHALEALEASIPALLSILERDG
jgi:futalosine hydrolase